MTPARAAAPRRSGPGAPVVLLVLVAVVLAAGALVRLVGPGRAPAHPYAAGSGGSQAEPASQSYEQGPADGPGAATSSAAPATPTVIPSDAAQQAALAAAAAAGSDAEQITAEGIALTSDDTAAPDPGIAPPADPADPARPAAQSPVVPMPLTRTTAPWAPPATAADLVAETPGTATPASLQAMAQAMMLGYGYGADQWGCLNDVVTRESGWHVTATNIRSGAYGLPQANPATKMATAGADWQTNPRTQLAWMLDYVHRRYGDPCGAWAHELSAGWY